MKAKLTVVAVSCFLAACGGDPEGNNTNGMQNNANNENNSNNENNANNENNTSGSNNNNGMNNPTNNGMNNPTNNGMNNPTNNATNNIPAAPMGAGLAVTADFGAGTSAWHSVDVDTLSADENNFGSGDLAVALGEAWAYVLDRNGAQVQVLDPASALADAGIIDVSGVGTTNPFDATDVGGSAYISLYNVGEIAVATPNGADWDQERLDLSAYDTDNNPEPGAILTDEGFVLVVLQTLDNFVGVDNSQLLAIDASDNSLGTPLDLGVTNAQAGFRAVGANFAVGVTGDYGANDGGILMVMKNAAGDYSVGDMVVSEEDLGGDILDFAFADETKAYAVITLPDFSSQLAAVDLSTGVDVDIVGSVAAPGYGGLDISADGNWLVVGDRTMGEEGFVFISLLDPDGEVFEAMPTLPPSGFVFLP